MTWWKSGNGEWLCFYENTNNTMFKQWNIVSKCKTYLFVVMSCWIIRHLSWKAPVIPNCPDSYLISSPLRVECEILTQFFFCLNVDLICPDVGVILSSTLRLQVRWKAGAAVDSGGTPAGGSVSGHQSQWSHRCLQLPGCTHPSVGSRVWKTD